MKKFKIAIDISPTKNANSKRGVGFYTKNLVKYLQRELKTNPEYKSWSLKLIKNCEAKRSHPKGEKLKIGTFDLLHYPYFDPFQLTLPQKTVPTIVTVHDLIPRQFKKHYPVGIKGNVRWLIQKNRLKKVDYIITDSHFSKYAIHKITKYPTDQIYPIYLGADPIFKSIKNTKELEKIRKKYKLPKKFVLYVGDINWNKNIPNLVRACLSLKYPLVIVGSAATRKNVINHPWNQDLLWLQKTHHPLLTLTGFVPDPDLAKIYNLATFYCQPSFAEGFGLTPLEAMQSGCPVCYSLQSSLAEIMDYNGVFFNPKSLKSIKKALKKLMTSPKLRQKFSKLGQKRARAFSWKLTALQTLAVYRLCHPAIATKYIRKGDPCGRPIK
ncbi:glycosyltransferase family 4 protein [Patescibacteria group bacterium]|nr:glycosyltransferase family 4 protein [Patescibacteria group bacterium]MCG2702076.1 glycosyltransferase family 4 protein [Candidatus Parcubacteria bacterium]MBU4265140.1 glycosyltransferase family 4 protein [Patescibacteria group bacterium]MBU4390704.1 glycosyltransferase family 4 protein [Patescibacteria group bacterium]MBU4397676.1 glycosyltransferase family 4 protein [Patescibacteria group bacterium]